MSISLTRACACGLRTVWPQSIPAAKRSLEYANSPVTFGIASTRLTLSPIRPCSSARDAVVIWGRRLGSDPGIRPPPSCSSRFAGEPDGVEDLGVAGATAEVARQRLADLVVARARVSLEQ